MALEDQNSSQFHHGDQVHFVHEKKRDTAECWHRSDCERNARHIEILVKVRKKKREGLSVIPHHHELVLR